MNEIEYDPIFLPGIHTISDADLEFYFVEPYHSTDRRSILVTQLEKFLELLKRIDTEFEIWIDGSFTTKKDNPNDIDMLIIYNDAALNSLSSENQILLKSLFDRNKSKIRYNIDLYVCPDSNSENISYWKRNFGFSRNDKAKGIARLKYGNN
jgi:hypothetical protein